MPGFKPRGHPPHGRPYWLGAEEVLLITFCTLPRGLPQLNCDEAWGGLIKATLHHEAMGNWRPLLVVAMPDHVHVMAHAPSGRKLESLIGSLKRTVTMRKAIRWQRGFFDHRPRNDQARARCREYVRMNPVRAGLVARSEDWPFIWHKGPRAWA